MLCNGGRLQPWEAGRALSTWAAHAAADLATAVEANLTWFSANMLCLQTGSGKTYTMAGGEQLARLEDGQLPAHCGLMPRVFDLLFSRIAEEEQQKANVYYSVECRCVCVGGGCNDGCGVEGMCGVCVAMWAPVATHLSAAQSRL